MPVCFEPVYDDRSKILILGSFPSVKSREEEFYYAHPQNRFWSVLDIVINGTETGLKNSSKEDKCSFLLKNGIALWDSVYSCDIQGSSDSSIKNVIPNDVARICSSADIRAVYCNGSTALKYYEKYNYPETGIKAIPLPSTSPANAAWRLNELAGFWSRIKIVLNRSDFSKRYYSLNDYAKDNYGHKLYKLSLDGGFTCPNRDGKISYGGCIFCDGEGSGHFAGLNSVEPGKVPKVDADDIREQLSFQKKLIAPKTGVKKTGYIAYFQSYTGTYSDEEDLKKKYMAAVTDPEVEILSIATRPDCLGSEVLALLKEINEIKPVWIELGLQTIDEKTAKLIKRGYELKVYDAAVRNLMSAGIGHIITHVILGLPGESNEQMYKTVEHVCRSGSQGIKLQLLHVIRGTALEKMYADGEFETLGMEEYLNILDKCMDILPPDMVVHRLSGDGNRNTLIAPLWSTDKKRLLNELCRIAKVRDKL